MVLASASVVTNAMDGLVITSRTQTGGCFPLFFGSLCFGFKLVCPFGGAGRIGFAGPLCLLCLWVDASGADPCHAGALAHMVYQYRISGPCRGSLVVVQHSRENDDAMMWLLGLVFSLFLLCYRSMLVFFRRGWQKAVNQQDVYRRLDLKGGVSKGSISPGEEAGPLVTVLVAARNETKRMHPLLHALTKQQTSFAWELLWIDDQSTDGSAEQVRTFLEQHTGLAFRVLERNGTDRFPPHKKGSIALGVEQALGRWILVTDADCVPGPLWIASMISKITSREGLVFVAGPVRLSPTPTLWERSQALEFMTLNAIAASTLAQGRPVISNGGNMAFDRQTFLECAPYDSNWKHPGGDDDLLMHQISLLRGPTALAFCLDKQALVDTPPLGSVREFLAQRIRWISKQGAYPDPLVSLILKSVWFMQALLLGVLLGGLCQGMPGLVVLALGTWALKAGMDGYYARIVAGFYERSAPWGLMFWTQLWYLPYTLGAGLAGYRGKFTWKGRNYG